MTDATRQAIIRAAEEEGIDPSFALAVAERESSFNPRARNSKTIRGLFQMRGDHRAKYGIGDSDDPYEQTKGWSRFIKDERAAASKAAGRDISDPELYGAHHFGAVRAGRMLNMDPNTPLDSVFTSNEMAQNPHFAKAGTVGKLMGSITSDIGTRQTKFGGGEVPDFSTMAMPVDDDQMPDYSHMGQAAEVLTPSKPKVAPIAPAGNPAAAAATLDFSAMGRPAT